MRELIGRMTWLFFIVWIIIIVCSSCTTSPTIQPVSDSSFTLSNSTKNYGSFSNDSIVQGWIADDYEVLLDFALEIDERSIDTQHMTGDMESLLDRMNARLDSLSAAKDTVWSIDTMFVSTTEKYYDIEYDSMGYKVYLPHGNVFRFQWTHDFKDTTNAWEQAIEFNVGLEEYATKDDMIKRVNGINIYYHKSYAKTTWSKYNHGRDTWEYMFTGLKPNKYYIISLQAIDLYGNESEWFKSLDSPEPCYILYEVGDESSG